MQGKAAAWRTSRAHGAPKEVPFSSCLMSAAFTYRSSTARTHEDINLLVGQTDSLGLTDGGHEVLCSDKQL